MTHPILTVYLQIQGLIVASYFLYAAFRLAYQALIPQQGRALLVHSARSLLLISILIPGVFLVLPVNNSAYLKTFNLRPLAEPEQLRLSKNAPRKVEVELLSSLSVPPTFGLENSFHTRLSTLILYLFTTGIGVFFIRLCKKYWELNRMVERSLPIREIGRVSLRISDETRVPLSTLLLHPLKAYVIMPSYLVQDPAVYKMAIFHEIQHHRQKDTLWIHFLELCQALFYPNPLIYLWRKKILELQELRCDEAVIAKKSVSRKIYGKSLVSVAESLLDSRVLTQAFNLNRPGTLGMANASFLRKRIEMLNHYKTSADLGKVATELPPFARGATAGLLTLLFSGVVTLAFATQPIQKNIESLKSPFVFDPNIQQMTDKLLTQAVQRQDALAGFVLVADVKSGKLLAASNVRKYPATSPDNSALWALSFRFPPISGMKPLIAAAAIDQGVTLPNDVHFCEKGYYSWGSEILHDWKPFDRLTTLEMFIQSSDICCTKVAQKFNKTEDLYQALIRFGFGSDGISNNLPFVRSGIFPDPHQHSQDQYAKENYTSLIAPGRAGTANFSVTPLELLYAYAALANGGQLTQPQPPSSGRFVRQAVSQNTAKIMQEGLRRVVSEGTGAEAKSQWYTLAGKTLTVRYPNRIIPNSSSPWSSNLPVNLEEANLGGFVGFAPARHPQIAVYAGVIWEPGKEVLGGSHAGPLFRNVSEQVLKYLQVKPDLPEPSTPTH